MKILLLAGVPVNHDSNLSWAALHEAIVLGSGGDDHIETVRLSTERGTDVTNLNGNGHRHATSPLSAVASRSSTSSTRRPDQTRPYLCHRPVTTRGATHDPPHPVS